MTDDGTACLMADHTAASYGTAMSMATESNSTVRDYRSHLDADDTDPYEFHLVRSPSQMRSAMKLVEHRYQDRGYRPVAGLRTSNLALSDSDLLTLTMTQYGAVCGTISIRFDGSHGLAADEVFPAEMRELRATGLRMCEFTKLALDIEDTSRHLLAHLFHRAYLCAFKQHDAELLVIEVNPRHTAFYRRLLGFKVRSGTRLNPRVNAPAVLLSLSMADAQQQIARYGGHAELSKVVRSLYPLGYSPEDEQMLLDSLMH